MENYFKIKISKLLALADSFTNFENLKYLVPKRFQYLSALYSRDGSTLRNYCDCYTNSLNVLKSEFSIKNVEFMI